MKQTNIHQNILCAGQLTVEFLCSYGKKSSQKSSANAILNETLQKYLIYSTSKP